METVKEKLAKLIEDIAKEEHILLRCIKDDAGEDVGFCCENCRFSNNGCAGAVIADRLIQNGVTIQEWVSVDEPPVARPLEEWHEDYGDVLWWKFPIEEPPYVGSPLCSDWTEYHTHWTPLPPCPEPPKGVQ